MPALESDGIALQTHHESADLEHLIDRVAHLLPSQGPIEVFVHHNTLHAFEAQSFHDAVKAGAARYDGNPYLLEHEYRRLLSAGRITDSDLIAVLSADLGDRDNEQIDGLGTRLQIRLAMLRHPLHIGPDAELRWIVAEADALERIRPEVSKDARERLIDATTCRPIDPGTSCDPKRW